MKITQGYYEDEDNWGQYSRVEVEIETNEGTKGVSFGGGEPEDFTLDRDLSGAWSIKELLVMAYNAGKAGEELTIEEITLED